jgi:hypothetical protein
MRLFALTFGGADSASTHYRLHQYREQFAAAGIEFAHALATGFKDFASLKQYDVVLLQKTLLAMPKVSRIRKHSKRFLYDADDLIWLSPQKIHSWLTRLRIEARSKHIAKSADLCMAANQIIAGDLRQRGGKTVVVPMALDGRKWTDAEKKGEHVTIGWSGAPKNLPFLRGILPELISVQRRFPEVRFAIHCGEEPKLTGLRYEHVRYVANAEPEAVRQFHIGLLPLPDEPFARGKSPIKALQYFASRVAVVGSPIGATREVLEDGSNSLWAGERRTWAEALGQLISEPMKRQQLSGMARRCFAERYGLPLVFEQLKRHLTAAD